MQSVLAGPPRRPAPVTSSRELPAALLRLADADAEALADRLHDDVLQALVVARYATDAVARGADPALARDAVQDALVALRRTVWQLRPRTAPGLRTALLDLSAQQLAAGRPALVLELDDEVAGALDPTAAAAAYRLVQAVLTECVGSPVVRLRRAGGRAQLEIDRCVPDPAGWSLRARALGGQLLVGRERSRLQLPLAERPVPDVPDQHVPTRDLPVPDREAAP